MRCSQMLTYCVYPCCRLLLSTIDAGIGLREGIGSGTKGIESGDRVGKLRVVKLRVYKLTSNSGQVL